MTQFGSALDVDDQIDAHLLFGYEMLEVVVQYAVLELAEQVSRIRSVWLVQNWHQVRQVCLLAKGHLLSEQILHENVAGAYDRSFAEIDFASLVGQLLDELVLLQHGQLHVALKCEAVPLRVLVHQIEQINAVHVAPFVDRFAEDVDVLVDAFQIVQQGGLAAADVAFDDDLEVRETFGHQIRIHSNSPVSSLVNTG